MSSETCTHMAHSQTVTPSGKGCKECLEMGDRWVHLRLCLTCGHVGCCDSSKNRHATKHFWATGHPIVRPLFWNRWEEMNLWEVEDAFMLGETLLVAPILEEGAQARDLTLPAGTWFSFWDDQP